MAYLLSEIAHAVGTENSPVDDICISRLLIDSRSLTNPAETVFFALTTQQNDGHKFVSDLYRRGVRAFVVNRSKASEFAAEMADASFLGVDNTLQALQDLACYCRDRFENTLIGVTGSRGKTIVKEWLGHVLKPDMTLSRSPRSYNSQIGVPLTIWGISGNSDVAVVEAGVSLAGEMESLKRMIRPQIGVLTNIGPEHDSGFKSLQEKCSEKLKLFSESEKVVFCADNELVSEGVGNVVPLNKRFGWSLKNNPLAQLQLTSSTEVSGSAVISFGFNGNQYDIRLPFSSESSVENACHVLAVALLLGVRPEAIVERMATLPQVDTRLSVIEGVNNCMLITDIGAVADPMWLGPALDFMHRRKTSDAKLTVVFIAPDPESLKGIGEILVSRGISRLIIVGESISVKSLCAEGLRVETFKSLQNLLTELSPSDFDHELILIQSSGRESAEMVVEMLEVRRHETVLEVNLDALTHNFNLIRSLVKPTTGIVAMVKADGYGAGSYELAKTLQTQGAAYLAVAVADEGVELRNRGVTMPIMVLNPKVTNYRTLFRYRLEPEIYSFAMLDEIVSQAQKQGVERFPVHIKIDSGMHRLGFLLEDMPRLVSALSEQTAVTPSSVFSHLAAADCPDMDDYTQMQFDYFDKCCDILQQGFEHHILKHILNSVGIARFPSHQFDMVRLGICLYGLSPLPLKQLDDLKPVSTLRTVIISIKEWDAGTTIGYSRRGILKRKSRIATIPIGYADGLNRHLGRGNASVWINGRRCPIVGNVCMDICMVDVTGCDCKEGDTVEIFGQNITAQELADKLGTIPYEILTSVSQRVKRVYYRE